DEGAEDEREARDAEPRGASAAPLHTVVQERQVEHPRQQREELYRVVVEHSAAARLRPDNARDDAEREQREADARGRRAYVVNGRQRRKPVKDGAELLQAKLALLPKVHHARGEGDEEGRVREEQQRRVYGEEPRRTPVRHAGRRERRTPAYDLRGQDEQGDHGEKECSERAQRISVRDEPVRDHERPREERERLGRAEERVVAVGHPVEDERARVRREAQENGVE